MLKIYLNSLKNVLDMRNNLFITYASNFGLKISPISRIYYKNTDLFWGNDP